MSIYQILSSKPHNKHYLNRYIKFIETRKQNYDGIIELHHICPRSKDLFPEYSSFAKHPWNKIKLSLKEHYIAHMILYKTFGKSQASAFHLMSNRTNSKTSKMYQKVRAYQIECFKQSNSERIEKGTHNFLTNNPSKSGNHHRTGAIHTPESKLKTSLSIKSKPNLTCPHCGKTGAHTPMKRWHFDNCKFLLTQNPFY